MKVISPFAILLLLSAFVFRETSAAAAAAVSNDGYLRHTADDTFDNVPTKKSTSSRRNLGTQQIVGGATTTGNLFPFFALLLEDSTDEDSYFCGGTLIASDRVLTAAHCFDDGGTIDVVRIGGTTSTLGEEIEVTKVTIHPNWDKTSIDFAYDFAVLELKKNSKERPVDMNWSGKTDFKNDTEFRAIGFGLLEEFGEASTVLKRVNLKFIGTDTCQQEFPFVRDDLHVCTNGVVKGSGICRGDSGGPLLFKNNTLIGVASFSDKPCGSGGFDVFADVGAAMKWINAQAFSTGCFLTRGYKTAVSLFRGFV